MSLGLAEGRIVRIPNEEITWAGVCPWTGSHCFGAESGKVFFFSESRREPILEYVDTLAEDAINGVAFFNDFIAVSTRSEVVVHRRVPRGAFELVFSGPGGAHGILATSTGQFLAPSGVQGLLCIDQLGTDQPRAWTDHAREAPLNYYSLRSLGHAAGKEVLACAARTDGLLTIQFDKDHTQTPITGLSAPDVDFLDVCSLGSVTSPFAVAALCADRSLVFVRDILTEDRPQTLRFDGFQGTPYSISSAQGHLFILTSHHITVIPNLAAQYLAGERLDQPIHYRQRSVQADDAFIIHEKELVILTDDGVALFEVTELLEGNVEPTSVIQAHESPFQNERLDLPDLVWAPLNTRVA
jgi:hypothetical protein